MGASGSKTPYYPIVSSASSTKKDLESKISKLQAAIHKAAFDIQKNEIGGLSGQPLRNLSTNMIKKFYKETKGNIQIIGVGGIDSGQAAFEKICAGANAVQLYTGMVYKGPGVVREMKKDLIVILKKENLKNINEAVGINA